MKHSHLTEQSPWIIAHGCCFGLKAAVCHRLLRLGSPYFSYQTTKFRNLFSTTHMQRYTRTHTEYPVVIVHVCCYHWSLHIMATKMDCGQMLKMSLLFRRISLFSLLPPPLSYSFSVSSPSDSSFLKYCAAMRLIIYKFR